MIPFLDAIAAAGMELFTRLGRALDEKRTGFSDYEAGDFLAAGGRMECDGPDAAEGFSAAGDAAEAGSAPVEPAPRAPSADPRQYAEIDLIVLLREAAGYIEARGSAYPGERAYVEHLAAGLRDLAARFDADEHPTT